MKNKKNSKNSFPVGVSSSKFHLRPCFCYLFWRSKGIKATERQMRVQGTRKLDNVIEVSLRNVLPHFINKYSLKKTMYR